MLLPNDQNERYSLTMLKAGQNIWIEDKNTGESYGLSAFAFGVCKKAVFEWLQQVVCPNTGAELNLHRRLNNPPAEFYISEDAWVRMVLLAKLTKGMKDGKRVELIGLRINRMGFEEANYLLRCWARTDWGVKGLRIMLSGDGKEREAVDEMLSKLRN